MSDGAQGAPAGAVARRAVLLRLDPAVHQALARWARDDLRSLNAQIEYLLRLQLAAAGRLPAVGQPRRPGRPPSRPAEDGG